MSKGKKAEVRKMKMKRKEKKKELVRHGKGGKIMSKRKFEK